LFHIESGFGDAALPYRGKELLPIVLLCKQKRCADADALIGMDSSLKIKAILQKYTFFAE
jgi:hypothetical protein